MDTFGPILLNSLPLTPMGLVALESSRTNRPLGRLHRGVKTIPAVTTIAED